MAETDVLIVGGGIAGASLGAELAARRNTVIVEAEQYCGYHATGRSAAFWLESYGGPAVAPLTRASRPLLDRPPADFHRSSFLRARGAVHIARTGDEAALAALAQIAAAADTSPLDRAEVERMVPGIRPGWQHALIEPGCADIDVAALHGAYLRRFARDGGRLVTGARLAAARFADGAWSATLADGTALRAAIIVDAAGAWADEVAALAGVRPLGIAAKRRTMVQLRVGRSGLRDLPLVVDAGGGFYFKGEGERSLWLSPHDEIDSPPTDAQPDELAVAMAIDRFEQAVDWPVEAVERRWAGLRSFAPDRLPVYGFDARVPGFFWFAGQGGFGIQTAPAAARLAAALLLGEKPGGLAAALDPAPYSPARLG